MDVTLYPRHVEKLARGGYARGATYAHVVEGRRYTTAQLSTLLGISHNAAWERTKRGPFPLTWAALRSRRKLPA